MYFFFFFSSRRRHTRCLSDWSSDVCSSDLLRLGGQHLAQPRVVDGLLGPILVALHEKEQAEVHGSSVRGSSGEIGRASCRERVEIWEVGVSVRVREKGR